MKENYFSTQQTINQSQLIVKIPKSSKTKLIKELNHKLNINSNEGRINSFKEFVSDQNIDALIGKSRFRIEKSFSAQIENNSNISNAKEINKCTKGKKLDGQVEFSDDNGNKFKGTYRNGMRVSGKMIYSKAKCWYEGSFLEEKFHGHGKLVYFNGRTIEGQWEQHFLIGNAVINYPNGDVYYGDVNRKLHRHGKGHLFFMNGDKYIGDFMNGSITGYGIFYQSDATIQGHWIQGSLVKEVKPGGLQDQQNKQGGNFKRVQYLKSGSSLGNNDSKQMLESLASPIASNIRLITQKNDRKMELTDSDILSEETKGILRRRSQSKSMISD